MSQYKAWVSKLEAEQQSPGLGPIKQMKLGKDMLIKLAAILLR